VVRPARAIGWSEAADGDAVLVQRCLVGDQQACQELVEAHQRMVYQLALHLLADPDEALDLSQEVFMRVFRTLSRFRGESAIRTWIYRIVVNQARNRQRWWRRRFRAQQVSLEEHVRDHGELVTRDAFASPDRQLGQKELGRRLSAALSRLPFDQRSAIVLREIHGLSYAEIAYSLGVAVGTVKSRLARARDALRSALQDQWLN
jgi:RNA polymerase sigma-70 factor (ECF subfamily)